MYTYSYALHSAYYILLLLPHDRLWTTFGGSIRRNGRYYV